MNEKTCVCVCVLGAFVGEFRPILKSPDCRLRLDFSTSERFPVYSNKPCGNDKARAIWIRLIH